MQQQNFVETGEHASSMKVEKTNLGRPHAGARDEMIILECCTSRLRNPFGEANTQPLPDVVATVICPTQMS